MRTAPIPPPGSRVHLLARFSSNLQNPMSAEDQLKVGREDAERFGWVVTGASKDEAKSGKYVYNRPGYLDAMAACEAGEADVLWCFQLDRLGRNARELHDAKNRLSDVNVAIYTHNRGVMSGFEFAMLAELAQAESENIAERTTRGSRAAAERGIKLGDTPYGYRAVEEEEDESNSRSSASRRKRKRRLEIDPVTSKIVLRANLDYDAGIGPQRIAEALTAEGVPTPSGKGKVWSPNSILGSRRSANGLLRNPLYIGELIHGKVKTSRDPKTGREVRKKADLAHQVRRQAPHLRIVPQDLWDRNQARLAEVPVSKLVDRRRPKYVFSGLARCGVCDGPFVVVTTQMGCWNHKMKACTNARRIDREDLETAALEGLVERVLTPQIVEWFIPEYLRESEGAQAQQCDSREHMAARLADVGREIDNLIEQVKSGAKGYAAQLLNDNLETLGAEQERLSRKLRASETVKPVPLTAPAIVERLRELLAELSVALNGEERDATRALNIIRSFITSVIITPIDRVGPGKSREKGVRITVEGAIKRLVDQALLEKEIMHNRGTTDVHNPPFALFRYYVDFIQASSEARASVAADTAWLKRAVEAAGRPLLRRELVELINERGRPPCESEAGTDRRRVRLALRQLEREATVKALRLGSTHAWVPTASTFSSREWSRLFASAHEAIRPELPTRVSPVEGYVVVVGEAAKPPKKS